MRKVSLRSNPLVKAAIAGKVPGSVVLFNQIPKDYEKFDLYCSLYYNDDKDNKYFDQNPRLGAFEISYRGKLIFSKLLSSYWPNVDLISSRAEKIVEAIRRDLDPTPYLARSLQGGKAMEDRPKTQGSGRRGFLSKKSPAKRRSPSPKVIQDADKIALKKMGKEEEEEKRVEADDTLDRGESEPEPIQEVEEKKEEETEWKKGEAKNNNIAMLDSKDEKEATPPKTEAPQEEVP